MTTDIIAKIKAISQEIQPQLIGIRRYLHQHPELSFQEFNTTAYIVECLQQAGILVERKYAETGAVGLINANIVAPGGVAKGNSSVSSLDIQTPDKVVALRGDIDALPIQELNKVPYKSQVEGVMHACGHDLHTAVTLGAALILQRIKAELPGTVKCIFQPGEEKNPGGASILTANGVLENPRVDVIFGLHSDPRLQVGEIGYRHGTMMASPDEFYITIKGKSGHGAAPNLAIDPIPIAAEIVLALQKIPSRLIDPIEPVVVTVGKIEGGKTVNVIPDTVALAGTVRTLHPDLAKKIHQMIERILKGITQAYGAGYELDYKYGYPVLINDESATDFLVNCGQEYLGKKNLKEITRPSMGGEDFAYYLQKVKGCFFRLGTGNFPKGITECWHSSHYDVDEDALPIGAGFMAYLAYRYLNASESP